MRWSLWCAVPTVVCLHALLLSGVCYAFLPAQNPPWKATYNMSLSTMGMIVNGSGYSDPAFGALFGIPSYDWSNAKVSTGACVGGSAGEWKGLTRARCHTVGR